ncbi:hypothetical protein QQF64_019428 [Cirrhinus molitorella]|uniref:Ig-like domain-containing protein n=1 Tax=Cirrhinus molitorella TaxID=172907 RepID=A0ABR3LFF7_9TELE
MLKKMVYTFIYFGLWLLGGVLSVYKEEEVETISVMEGDSVILNTNVTEKKKDDHILWTFRPQNSETRIAEIYKHIISIYDNEENNERFRGRLQIDEQTGSLTITNINKLHSGLYKVQIISGDVKHKSFSIAVYAPLTIPVISDSPQNPSVSKRSSNQNCSLLCSVLDVSDVSLSWYKGNCLLSSISVSDLNKTISLPLEIECLDDSYSCVVAYSFTNRTAHLNITDLCWTCPGAGQSLFFTLSIIFVCLLLLLVSIVVLVFCHRKNYKQATQEAQTTEEEVSYTDVTFAQRATNVETNGREQAEYSEVHLR